MKKKDIHGRAIYKPNVKAPEYSGWACPATYAAPNRGVIAASVNLNGSDPLLAISLIALLGISIYTTKQYVDKETRETGRKEVTNEPA